MTRAEKLEKVKLLRVKYAVLWLVFLVFIGWAGYHLGGVWGLIGAVTMYCGIDAGQTRASLDLIVKLEKMNNETEKMDDN